MENIKLSDKMPNYTLDRRQSKTKILSTNINQKSLKNIVFYCGDKCQSKTLFLSTFDLRSSIVKSGVNLGV